MKFLKRMICKHKNQRTVTNIGGDFINLLDARSIRICKDCGKSIFSPNLDTECTKVNEFIATEED